jgi:Fe-S oxidoreductase
MMASSNRAETSMKKLDELKPLFRICEQCGTCTAACHFSDTGAQNVRRLIRHVNLGLLDDAFLSEAPWLCSACGRCAALCTEGLDIPALVEALRRLAGERGLAPPAAGTLARSIAESGAPFRALGKSKRSWVRPDCAPTEGAKVLYWTGCGPSLMLPSLARATARLLRAVAGGYALLEEEPCCGEPLGVLGRTSEAAEATAGALRALRESGAETVVTSCSGCFLTFGRHAPGPPGGKGDGPRILHLSQFLDEQKPALSLGKKLRLAYHDPCSLGRGMGVYDAPRRVLGSIEGVEIVEIDPRREGAVCCGGGGGVWALRNEEAVAQGLRNLERHVLGLGADGLVTCCPVCHLNFRTSLRRKKSRVRVYDLAEVAAMGLSDEGE